MFPQLQKDIFGPSSFSLWLAWGFLLGGALLEQGLGFDWSGDGCVGGGWVVVWGALNGTVFALCT